MNNSTLQKIFDFLPLLLIGILTGMGVQKAIDRGTFSMVIFYGLLGGFLANAYYSWLIKKLASIAREMILEATKQAAKEVAQELLQEEKV